jgi:hypothetical protein
MYDHRNLFRGPARPIALHLLSRCRRPLRRAAGMGLIVLWPVVTSALGYGGPPPQNNRAAADKTENVLVVRVTSDGKPVAGAEVVANASDDLPAALTGGDGLARVPLPAGGKINWLVALHPTLGVGGHQFGFATKLPTSGGHFELALVPPKPHTVRVVDVEGRPVPDLTCVVESVNWAKNWFPMRRLEMARFKTGADGNGVLGWIPSDLRSVIVRPLDERWKMDDCKTGQGLTTVKVRRLEAVQGRLRMPERVSAEGLTISADGMGGESNWPHNTKGRVRGDGSFTIYLAAGDAYAVQLTDPKWASDAWTGILPRDTAPPAIDLVAYPATPLSVRVTRGPRHEAVGNAWILMRSRHTLFWKGSQGRSLVVQPGIQNGLYTDGLGRARFSVGKGDYSLFMATGKWRDERSITVGSHQPVQVAFDRAWTDKRTITGRLLFNHKPHQASAAAIVRAWRTAKNEVATRLESVATGTIQPDGRFTVELDADSVCLYAVDPQARLAAFGKISGETSAIDLQLVPMGSYSGVVVDESGKPLADHAVQLIYDGADLPTHDIVFQSTTCDERGRFKLDAVPARAPLEIYTGTPANARETAFSMRAKRFQSDGELDFYLDPGEARENVRLVAITRSADGSRRVKPPREPVEAHLKRRIRDVRLAGMRLLVILQGDASKAVAEFTATVRGSDEPPELLRYIPLYFEADEIETAPGFLSGLGWERPKAGEVVLVAVDGAAATLGIQKITVAGNQAAEALAAQFIKRYALPSLDAQKLLDTAQREARTTGRRLVFVEGGPRCEPCRELARWMDNQHTLLSKDYVILKVLGTETHSSDVIGKFRSNRNGGIPWFAIAEPDGTVLATSDSPLGNTGLPSSFEEKKYFKTILDRTARNLTPAERVRLIESLPKE